MLCVQLYVDFTPTCHPYRTTNSVGDVGYRSKLAGYDSQKDFKLSPAYRMYFINFNIFENHRKHRFYGTNDTVPFLNCTDIDP